MESGSLNIIIGKGPSARTLDLPLPPLRSLPPHARGRPFGAVALAISGGVFRLEFYSEDDMRAS